MTSPSPAEPTQPFPSLPDTSSPAAPKTTSNHGASARQSIDSGVAPSTRPSSSGAPQRRTRGSSIAKSFLNSNLPFGMWQATGEIASKVPTLGEIRKGSFSVNGWTEEGQMEQRGHTPHQITRRQTARLETRQRRSSASTNSQDLSEYLKRQPTEELTRVPSPIPEVRTSRVDGPRPDIDEKADPVVAEVPTSTSTSEQHSSNKDAPIGPDETGTYPNGYRFPAKHTWTQSTVIGLKAFWKFFLTPFGFLVTLYGLNVVAWGAMLFFVLLKAAPAMCHPTCDDDYSARKIWIEITSQILNGLFCVTGFGLIPWRFRDLYYLLQWRWFKKYDAWRRLAGYNRGWYRLAGSQELDEHLLPPPKYNKKHPKTSDDPPEWPEDRIVELEQNQAVPLPATSMPQPPLTGIRASPSKPWLIDLVVWMYIWNTIIQGALSGAMWGLNRFTRPGWVTGFLISLGAITGIIAGIVVFREGKRVKNIEGIPVEEEEILEDAEKGVGTVESKTGTAEQPSQTLHKSPTGASTMTLTRTKTKGRHWYERH